MIRNILPQGLGDKQSRVRATVVSKYCISQKFCDTKFSLNFVRNFPFVNMYVEKSFGATNILDYMVFSWLVAMVMWQAYAISAIARWDWPDEWPDLFNQLVQAVASGDPCLVHGAMRVLTGRVVITLTTVLCHCVCIEFCQEVTDQQMPHVAPIIFPQLLQVIAQPQV